MTRLKRRTRPVAALAGCFALVAGSAALGGCGSGGTKTVSISSSSPPGTTAKRATTKGTTPSPTSTTKTNTAPSATPEGGVEATRTSTAPAFAERSSGGELATAVATVKAHGYTPNDTSDYHSDQTLRVLVATRTGSGDGYAQQAFFFVDGRYIGTDTSAPSAGVKVVSQNDTEVTLAYPLYRASDPLCCPGGGQETVRFQLNDGRLQPLDPIPPSSSKTGLSRQ